MKKTALIFMAPALICGGLRGQNVVYQQAGAIGGTIRVSGGPMGGEPGMVTSMVMGGRTMTGSPFSGTEQRHSLQVLGDGTRIEQTESSQIARDAEGRMRTESLPAGSGMPAMITIQDPVAGANYVLDTAHKTANIMHMAKALARVLPAPASANSAVISGPVSIAAGTVSAAASPATEMVKTEAVRAMAEVMQFQSGVNMQPAGAPDAEDLGIQNVNGVLAKGTRTTINIPAGKIGNDRAIQVLNERWYSDELGMIVKSSNSDPRFGTITYELTNISRGVPDPSLFQVPADYTVNEGRALFTTGPAK